MNKFLTASIVLAAAFAAGFGASHWFGGSGQGMSMAGPAERKPLYWVAPMDPNFRRDKPGKSPMGMDLVPVYEEDSVAADAPGTVQVSAAVENSLGVRTARVERRALPREVRTVGYVGYDEDRLHHVHLRVSGWIERLGVTSAGDPVRDGQVLLELYSPEIVNAQEELLLALRSGEKALLRAARRKLEALGLKSVQVSELERSGKASRTVPIRSHRDGYVSHLMVRHGMFVKPETEVLSIGQLDTVWITAEVFERQSSWVKPGDPVEIRLEAWPDRTWEGRVDYVYPVLDASSRTTRVRIRVPNGDEALRPNMYASVRLLPDAGAPTLVIPREALIRTGRMQRVVCALGNGRFLSVQVRTGREAGDWVEVLDGLSEGDLIVTSAQFLIDSESSLSAEFNRMAPAEAGSAQESGTHDHRDAASNMDHDAHGMEMQP